MYIRVGMYSMYMLACSVIHCDERCVRRSCEVALNFVVTDVHAYQAYGRAVARAAPAFCDGKFIGDSIELRWCHAVCEVAPCQKLLSSWQQGAISVKSPWLF